MDLTRSLDILGLVSVEGLTFSTLKTTYKRLAKERHPDKMSGSSNEFVKLRKGYLFLVQYLEDHPEVQGKEDIVPLETEIHELSGLSKEELIDMYISDTRELEVRANQHIELISKQHKVIQEARDAIGEIVNDFEQKRDTLEREFELQLGQINTKKRSAWKIFSKNSVDENTSREKYSNVKSKYSQYFTQLDTKLHEDLLAVYGDSLHQIINTIEQESKTE